MNQMDWGPPRYNGGCWPGTAERGVAMEGYSSLKDT